MDKPVKIIKINKYKYMVILFNRFISSIKDTRLPR